MKRLEYPPDQRCRRIGHAPRQAEQRLQPGVRPHQLVERRQLGRLGHLRRHGVDELRDEAGGRVVRLAEVVGHDLGGEGAQGQRVGLGVIGEGEGDLGVAVDGVQAAVAVGKL